MNENDAVRPTQERSSSVWTTWAVKLLSCYMADCQHEGRARRSSSFGKDMGMEYFRFRAGAGPRSTSWRSSATSTESRSAIPQHPSRRRLLNPEKIVEVTRAARSGSATCCDTGHWVRFQAEPVRLPEALEGRIISFPSEGHRPVRQGWRRGVPWGTGKSDIRGILAEIRRQGIQL